MEKKILEKAYRLFDWKDDPKTRSGKERYVKALAKFKSLLGHPWFQDIPKEVQILDLCGGMGIGGVALAKTLQERGYSPRLTLLDIRGDAIKEAEKFSTEEGVTCRCIAGDALEAYSLGRFDIVLLYGAPLPHFDAWMFPRLLASASEATKDNGILVIEEMDRVYFIFTKGFKDFLVESMEEGRFVVSVHKEYDHLRDVYRRFGVDLISGESVEIELTFRSIATIASFVWMFYEQVDIVGGDDLIHLIIGKKPRRKIMPRDLKELPSFYTKR
ncbi:MAG: hypothetical protein DRJ35_04735 [Thermoprotei archaeon]|nr:MAG: hypothetical protein DRJ35_04735 [Thermoprotei archaeon]